MRCSIEEKRGASNWRRGRTFHREERGVSAIISGRGAGEQCGEALDGRWIRVMDRGILETRGRWRCFDLVLWETIQGTPCFEAELKDPSWEMIQGVPCFVGELNDPAPSIRRLIGLYLKLGC